MPVDAGLDLSFRRGARLAATLVAALAALAGPSHARASDLSPHASFGVTEARADAPWLDGGGMVAAVIDSGIDAGHQQLDGKVIGFADCMSGTCVEADPSDDLGHGTHVAATLAGVAPGAKLVGVKVIGAVPDAGTKERLVDAVEWVIAHRAQYGIDVLNMSVGIPTDGPFAEPCSMGTDDLSDAAELATEAGILVVAAAGNAGPDPCGIGSPAAAPSVLTVGNMADLRDSVLVDGMTMPVMGFRLDLQSSRGPTRAGAIKPDLLAPGVWIESADAGTVELTEYGHGTSASAPFAAGVALLMRQAAPLLLPAEVKQRMMATAVDWGPPGADNDYGAGRLDAYAALAAAGVPLTSPPAVPMHEHHEGVLAGPGDEHSYELSGVDASFPLAATLLVPSADATGPNVDLVLHGPSGAVVASARHVPGTPREFPWLPRSGRQETLELIPGAPGTYTLDVVAVDAGAAYSLDVSRAPAPPVPVAAPVITGVARVGVPLSASAGEWAGAAATTELRWESCGAPHDCEPVAGATGTGFTPAVEHVGRMLRVVVEAENDGGTRTAASALTAPVAPGMLAAAAPPTIVGTAAIGSVLTAAGGDWEPEPAQSSLAWLRCDASGCSAPVGTGSTHIVTVADAGKRLRVRETVSAPGYETASAESAATATVAAPPAGGGSTTPPGGGSTTPPGGGPFAPIAPLAGLALQHPPALRGTAAVGARLRAGDATWLPAPAGRERSWLLCGPAGDGCAAIAGASGSSLRLRPAHAGRRLLLRETASAAGFAPAVALSGLSAVVAPGLRLAGTPAADRLTGREGDDVLRGRGGPDRLRGGAGSDRLDGGAGADVLLARDGAADRVRCGAGRDRVVADAGDAVRADCERVRRRTTSSGRAAGDAHRRGR